MRLLVCGGRRLWIPTVVTKAVRAIHERYTLTRVIDGAAAGMDTAARCASYTVLGVPSEEYPANWKEEGLSAGPRRNRRMMELGQPTMGLAMTLGKWHESLGTADMLRVMQDANLPYKLFEVGVFDDANEMVDKWIADGCIFDSHIFGDEGRA